MVRRRLTVAALLTIWALALAPSAHSAASMVRVTASVRPKVTVFVADNASGGALIVKANTAWTISVQQIDAGGEFFAQTFTGNHTRDGGTVLPTKGRVEGFTVLANP